MDASSSAPASVKLCPASESSARECARTPATTSRTTNRKVTAIDHCSTLPVPSWLCACECNHCSLSYSLNPARLALTNAPGPGPRPQLPQQILQLNFGVGPGIAVFHNDRRVYGDSPFLAWTAGDRARAGD